MILEEKVLTARNFKILILFSTWK